MLQVSSTMMLLVVPLVGSLGCAGGRGADYRAVPPSRAGDSLRDKAVVVEGVVTDAQFGITPRTPLTRYLFWWIPAGAPAPEPGWSATLAVDRVLRGAPATSTIPLREMRPLAREEAALFPDHYGVHIGSRLRLGYDRRRGGTLNGLTIVPLGNAPGFDVEPAPATQTSGG
jgi:hypothetical protein